MKPRYLNMLNHTVSQNFLFLSLWNLILIGLPFLTIPYLMRAIGPQRYGLLAFAQAFIQYFTFFLDYGFNYSAVREISINRGDSAKISSIFSAVITLKIFFLAFAILIVLTACLIFPRFQNDWKLYFFTLSYLVGYGFFPTFILTGMERIRPIFFLSLPTILTTICVFLFVKTGDDFLMVPILNGLGILSSTQLALWFVRKKMRIRWSRPSLQLLMHELKEGWRIFLSNLIAVGHSSVRIFFVGLLSGNVITAYYVVGERLMNIMILFPLGLLVQVLYPRLSHIFVEDRERVGRLTDRLQKITGVCYFILCFTAYAQAPTIITWLCGTPSPIAIVSYRLLLISVFLTAVNAFYIQWFLATGRLGVVSRIGIATGLVGTVLVYPLIKVFSYQGAAYSIMIILIAAILMTHIEKKKASALYDITPSAIRSGA